MNKIKLISSDECTACGACVNVCPKHAIHFTEDPDGFAVPVIDENACVSCEKCIKICPINHTAELKNTISKTDVYAAFSKDVELAKQSSSGGIFSVLAGHVIDAGGIVYGAAFDNSFTVRHIGVETKEDLTKLRGSKYVQSAIAEDLFAVIQNQLEQDRKVLFSGTPCQVAGLKSFLGRDYPGLLLVDLICHGVPAPKVFAAYLEAMKQKYGQELTGYSFRDKKKGWKRFNIRLTYRDKEQCLWQWQDPYMKLYLHITQPFLRASCYQCRFMTPERVSDITLGDFWGYTPTATMPDKDTGISCILCNTAKGNSFYSECLPCLQSEKRDLSELKHHALHHNMAYDSIAREKFWADYHKSGFLTAAKKFDYSFYMRLNFYIKQYFPQFVPFCVKLKRVIRNTFKPAVTNVAQQKTER